MTELFEVRKFDGRPGRIENLGVVFEGSKPECERFVDAKENMLDLLGEPSDTFFEIDKAVAN